MTTALALRGVVLGIVTFLGSWFVIWKGGVWLMGMEGQGVEFWRFMSVFFAIGAVVVVLIAHFTEKEEE